MEHFRNVFRLFFNVCDCHKQNKMSMVPVEDLDAGVRLCLIILGLYLSLQLLWVVNNSLNSGRILGDKQFMWLKGNRDLRKYVLPKENTTLLEPQAHCNSSLYLLILVTSAPGNAEQRQAVRSTWGHVVSEPITKLLFFLGHESIKHPPQLTKTVLSEAKIYGDIVVENFFDSYQNLTLKTIFMMKWAIHHCNQMPFILKTDDDMLINIRAILQMLKSSRFELSQPLIIGRIQEGARPYRYRSSKWYLPHWLYEASDFPTFASGTAYVMTYTAMSNIYASALDLPFLPLEDVFLTGLVATKTLGIPLINIPKFHKDRPLYFEHPCLYHHLLTVHEFTPTQLKRIWRALMILKPAECDSLYLRFLAFLFGVGQYEIDTGVLW